MEPQPKLGLIDGVEETYVLKWPQDVPDEDAHFAAAILISRRLGGFLVAIPVGFIPLEELQTASSASDSGILGPHTILSVPSVLRLDAESEPVPTGQDVDVQVVDMTDEGLAGIQLLSMAGLEEGTWIGFSEDPALFPDARTLLQFAMEWIKVSEARRTAFYSAEEGEVTDTPKAKPKEAKTRAEKPKKTSVAQATAEHISAMAKLLPTMAAQIAELQKNQLAMQAANAASASTPAPRPSQMPVSMSPQAFASMLGSPPRTKSMNLKPPPAKKGISFDTNLSPQEQAEAGEEEDFLEETKDPLALAMLQQSRALTALVSHMQQGDPLIDGHASGTSMSSRGAQGREKMQRELAMRTGGFFLTVMQNMHRGMKPALPVPQTLEAMGQTDLSMVHYLERFGGYGSVGDMGIVQYALAFIVDMALRGDLQGVQEHLALLVVGMEQYAQDAKWDLGFLLILSWRILRHRCGPTRIRLELRQGDFGHLRLCALRNGPPSP